MEITDNFVKILHGESVKTSSFYCIRLTVPLLNTPVEELEEPIIADIANTDSEIMIVSEIDGVYDEISEDTRQGAGETKEEKPNEIPDDRLGLPWRSDALVEDVQV